MEFQILIDICFIACVAFLRFKIYTALRKWYLFAAYAVCLIAIVIKLDWSMWTVRVHYANSALDGIEASSNTWLLIVANFYANYDPFIKLFFLVLTLELVSFFNFMVSRFYANKAGNHLVLVGVMTHWWANIILFMGAPALLYGLMGLNDVTEKSLMSINYCLSPIVAVYGTPAYLLGIHPAPSDYLWNSNYPLQSIDLDNFNQDAAPWFIFCFLMTIAHYLVYRRQQAKIESISLRELFIGDLRWRECLYLHNIKRLPWRGMLILAFVAVCLVLTCIAIIVNFIFYGIILLVYNILWIAPLGLILIVVWILIKNKSK
jgi:hypothetical protein